MKRSTLQKTFLPIALLCAQRIALLGALAGAACKDIPRPPVWQAVISGGTDRIGIVSTDFGAAGRFSTMTPDGFPVPGFQNIHSDAVARFQDTHVYIINRLNRDNIQVLDPSLTYLTVQEFSTGGGSNPQDFIRVSDTKGYVTLFNKDSLLIVNPLTGLPSGQISLAAWADADGLPEMSGMHLEGNLLYVALERLDRSQSFLPPAPGPAVLIEINVLTDSVTGAFSFQGQNPFGKLRRVILGGQPHIVVPSAGRLGFISALDGGVEAFNLVTRSFRPGYLFSEAAAGGDIVDAAVKNDTEGYAVVLDAAFNKSVQKFNPQNGQLLSVLARYPSTAGTVAGLLLTPNGYLYAGDASFANPGIRIYDTNRGDLPLTPAPINVGLRPFDIIQIP
ncbi:MAG: hypothetical protein HY042_06145 [Spirochaetia bacterium]|nr:hypothetical protein [Spirochaetia bacterium]